MLKSDLSMYICLFDAFSSIHTLLVSWTNVDPDVLCCDACDAVVAISFMRGLSTFAADKLTCLYEQQLGQAHGQACPFRNDAVGYFQEESKTTAIVPFPFVSFVGRNPMLPAAARSWTGGTKNAATNPKPLIGS